ncbi:MAG TPA: glucosamine-6-phosphate deaminase [Bacteriovoracaceae bacterium]|nr:glucosamine-6-phosphate deaminase [Bacteriovoracaceae bacterium]
MRIILSESTSEAVQTVAEAMLEKIESISASVLGLATGNTMIPVYEAWVQMALNRSVDHSYAFFFMLDEYLGINADHPSGFQEYVAKHLFNPLGIRKDQFTLPPVHDEGSYERTIKESGGIDLQLLGIGTNGHIGFNEPGSTGNSRTRRVILSEETIAANSKNFQGKMPTEAITMGIQTILESKSIILLATGKSKADAVKYLMNHHDDPACPATFLKSHPHFTLVIDPDAASKVNLKI